MSLSRCCRLFGVSRQSIYQAHKRRNQRSKELTQVKDLVNSVRMEMPRLGTRKLYYLIKSDLDRLQIKIGRDALFAFLKAEHMLIKPKRSYTKTTHSKHWLKKYTNLLEGCEVQRPEQIFVSDITYVKSREKTHYLSLVTDAYSRKIMGYTLSDDLNASSVVKALKMAVNKRSYDKLLIHHSDRGLQYCSSIYQEELNKHGILPSMTEGYDCYQNALAERINGILKQEFLINKCKDAQELKKLIEESIHIYNSKRPHLSLNMKTPNYIHEKTEVINNFGSI